MNLFKSSIRQLRHALNTTLNPLQFRQYVLRNSKNASLEERVAFDVFERPHYAYGVYRAAQQAKALGIARISVLEFGCAGGNGLVALESISEEVTAALGIQIDVYGFDIGEGLPRPLDFRDLPYAWKAGQFKMDIPKLKSKLAKAELVIGDVADTVGPFSEREELAPLGFVSFDLDFYSSTAAALRIFEGRYENILPRVYCYFDDCIGPDNELHSHFTGELLAIDEFNERQPRMKLAKIHGFAYKRIFPSAWNEVTYVLHAFDHPMYGTYIDTGVDMELALED